jgi:8-oxo-dGTP pyrophosphatase MutT (NUDIX family)
MRLALPSAGTAIWAASLTTHGAASLATQPSSIEIIARGVLMSGSRVLLCRSVKHDYFYLPGGHVEFGEAAGEALRREFEEETGLSVRVGACQLVSEGFFQARSKSHHELNLVFHVEHVGPEEALAGVRSREESIAFEWAELGAIVDLDVRPLAMKAWLAAGGRVETGDRTSSGGDADGLAWVSEFPEARGQGL